MSIEKNFLQQNHLTLIKSFTVLWKGWDYDSEWYLTENANGDKIFAVINYGSSYIGNLEELKERIEYYKEITKVLEEVLKEFESK